jgi:hypothetical protein
MHAKFEAEVNERLFGFRPQAISEELQAVLRKCGVPQSAFATFLQQEILSLSDAKMVFHPQQAQPALLALNVMQWTRLCRELNPPQ